jgi:hypothetical protein
MEDYVIALNEMDIAAFNRANEELNRGLAVILEGAKSENLDSAPTIQSAGLQVDRSDDGSVADAKYHQDAARSWWERLLKIGRLTRD